MFRLTAFFLFRESGRKLEFNWESPTCSRWYQFAQGTKASRVGSTYTVASVRPQHLGIFVRLPTMPSPLLEMTGSPSFNMSKQYFYPFLISNCKFAAILTTFVFYIPGIEHKVSFSIAVLVTLTVFYLVLIDLIPPTSMVIPLIGKYLLFTMFLVSASIFLSVLTVSYYRRYVVELFLPLVPSMYSKRGPYLSSFKNRQKNYHVIFSSRRSKLWWWCHPSAPESCRYFSVRVNFFRILTQISIKNVN